jgi:hypothetical protein
MKTDIEYAALVMGFDDAELDAVTETIITVHLPGMRCFWMPLEDDGDSRRLEIACFEHLHATRTVYEVERTEEVLWLRECYGGGKPERVREAVFALAVAIGKTIEGNNNAD